MGRAVPGWYSGAIGATQDARSQRRQNRGDADPQNGMEPFPGSGPQTRAEPALLLGTSPRDDAASPAATAPVAPARRPRAGTACCRRASLDPGMKESGAAGVVGSAGAPAAGSAGTAGGQEQTGDRQGGRPSARRQAQQDGVPDGDPAGAPHVGVDAEAVRRACRVTCRTACPPGVRGPPRCARPRRGSARRLARGSSAEQPSGTSRRGPLDRAPRETRCTGATPGPGGSARGGPAGRAPRTAPPHRRPPDRAWRAPARPWRAPDGPPRRRPSMRGRRPGRSARRPRGHGRAGEGLHRVQPELLDPSDGARGLGHAGERTHCLPCGRDPALPRPDDAGPPVPGHARPTPAVRRPGGGRGGGSDQAAQEADRDAYRAAAGPARQRGAPGQGLRPGLPLRPGPEEGRPRAPPDGHRAARRVPDPARRRADPRSPRVPAVPGRGRQGRDHPARHERGEPAGGARQQLQGPVRDGTRPRLPVAVRPPAARPGRDRHLQPVALRGGPRGARPPRGPGPPEAAARRGRATRSGTAATGRSTTGSATWSTTGSWS